jgi:hypothetical protein
MLDEERYQRRPDEERRYRADSIAVAAALKGRPDLVAPDVAEQMLGMAQEIGHGGNPERSTVAGRAIVRNVVIMMAGGAIGSAALIYASPAAAAGAAVVTTYLGMLTISETIKKTHWFKSITQSMATNVDNALDRSSVEAAERLRSGLRRQRVFVEANEPILRRLAGERKEFEFLHRALDWLRAQTDR